jgi:cytochrome c oxidase subunit 3
MTTAVSEQSPPRLGIPVSNGKLAIWLFLVTEIMFFTGLIGTYIVLRNGSRHWPKPEQVHLEEFVGAFNTFVLICSSLTVVLAHSALGKHRTGKAVLYIAATFALGLVFLVVKAYEYNGKFRHDILPGKVKYDRSEGKAGVAYRRHVEDQLQAMLLITELKEYVPAEQIPALLRQETLLEPKPVKHLSSVGARLGASVAGPSAFSGLSVLRAEEASAEYVLFRLKLLPNDILTEAAGKPLDYPPVVIERAKELLAQIEEDKQLPKQTHAQLQTAVLKLGEEVEKLQHKYEDLPLDVLIPNGNIWASCYFIMTGFHAIHVFGGLIVFTLMMLLALFGRFGPRHESFVELTGLYWHFVDIVWIFLFPLLYLV